RVLLRHRDGGFLISYHGDTETRRRTLVGAPLAGALRGGTESQAGHPRGVPLLATLLTVLFSVSPCLHGMRSAGAQSALGVDASMRLAPLATPELDEEGTPVE